MLDYHRMSTCTSDATGSADGAARPRAALRAVARSCPALSWVMGGMLPCRLATVQGTVGAASAADAAKVSWLRLPGCSCPKGQAGSIVILPMLDTLLCRHAWQPTTCWQGGSSGSG